MPGKCRRLSIPRFRGSIGRTSAPIRLSVARRRRVEVRPVDHRAVVTVCRPVDHGWRRWLTGPRRIRSDSSPSTVRCRGTAVVPVAACPIPAMVSRNTVSASTAGAQPSSRSARELSSAGQRSPGQANPGATVAVSPARSRPSVREPAVLGSPPTVHPGLQRSSAPRPASSRPD